MPRRSASDVRYWRVEPLDGLELLRATYRRRESARHSHEGYEIAVIERGSMRVHVQGASHVAGAHAVVVIHPDEPHIEATGDDDGWTSRSIFPSAENLHDATDELGRPASGTTMFSQPVIDDADVARVILELHRLLERSHTPLERESLALQAARMLVSRHGRHRAARASRPEPRRLRRAIDLMEDRYADDLSLSDLATAAGVTACHLSRLFTAHAGVPPHEYLIQVRLRRARELLAAGLPLSRVAVQVGFVDQSHLTRRFSRAFGLTPGQFAAGVATSNAYNTEAGPSD